MMATKPSLTTFPKSVKFNFKRPPAGLRGEMKQLENKNRTVVVDAWADTKACYFLTSVNGYHIRSPGFLTIHPEYKHGTVTRNVKAAGAIGFHTETIDRPQGVENYAMYMDSVDQLNQNGSYYRVGIRGSNRFYQGAIYWQEDMCIHNAQVLLKEAQRDSPRPAVSEFHTLRHFLAESLLHIL